MALNESFISLINIHFLRLCLVFGKFEVKCEEKKIERKSKRIKNVKKNKNRFKVNKLFYMLLQTHLT